MGEQKNVNARQGVHNFEAAYAAGAAATLPVKQSHGRPDLFVVPKGYDLKEAPRRDFVVQQITTDKLGDFIAYVKRYGGGHACVLENLPERAIGLIDYHARGGGPSANRHKISLCRERHPRFAAWEGFVACSTVDQRSFVEFVEEHQDDVIDPVGGALLDLIRKVESKTEANFSSVINESGLQRVIYAEDTQVRSGEKGTLEVPREFKLRLPLFREGALYDLRIRVRLAVREGRLSFRLAWLNKDDALENDAQSAAALLHGQLDDFCHVQRGTEGAGE